jgi:hypothetical protein
MRPGSDKEQLTLAVVKRFISASSSVIVGEDLHILLPCSTWLA